MRGGNDGIPPLKTADGVWVFDSVSKAKLFVESFESKASMFPANVNEYTYRIQHASIFQMSGFLPIRQRLCKQVLSKLREDSGTGPDLLSAKVLKQCANSLSYPCSLIARAIISESKWLLSWRNHWMYPLHKKKVKVKQQITVVFISQHKYQK